MGYSLLGIERNASIDWDRLLSVAAEKKIKILGVVIVSGSTRAEMRRSMEESKGKGELVVAAPRSLDALRYSSVRKEIHLVKIVRGMEKYVDASQATLFRNRGWGAVEVSLSELWRSGGVSFLYEVMRRAYELKVDLVVTSGATSAEELWSPQAVIGLISSFSISRMKALSWITSVPARIAELSSL